jgi:hypothetical protein
VREEGKTGAQGLFLNETHSVTPRHITSSPTTSPYHHRPITGNSATIAALPLKHMVVLLDKMTLTIPTYCAGSFLFSLDNNSSQQAHASP